MQRAPSSLLRLRTITRPVTRSYSAGTYNSVEDIQKGTPKSFFANFIQLFLIQCPFFHCLRNEHVA